MASSKSHDLEITIISAKHLKNVNWRNGDLKPYATFYLDNSDHRLATHADDSLSTRPVWNERFTLPMTRQIYDSVLTLEIFHSKPSETPQPLVGTVRFPLSNLIVSDESLSCEVRTLELLRPSGRPQGKVRVKLEVKERPLPPPVQDYHTAPNYSHYYNPAPAPAPAPAPPPPPPPPARDYREYAPSPYGYADPYGYYPAYYPPQPPRPLYNRASNYSLPGGPSAPVDLSAQSSPSPYDHKPPPPPPPGLFQKTSNYGVPSGPSAPVDYSHGKGSGSLISGAMGGLSLEEGSNYEKEKVATDKESHSYHDYRREY